MFYKKRYNSIKSKNDDLKQSVEHMTELYQRVLSENHEHLKTIKGLKELINKNKHKSKKNDN